MQKEWHIVLKSGLECRWTSPLSQGGVMAHTGAIYVKGASRVVAVEWDSVFSELAIKPKFKCHQSTRSMVVALESPFTYHNQANEGSTR
jgi:hypothetical protein